MKTETPLGPIWFWGRDTGRPVLLIITGVFENADRFANTPGFFHDADVMWAHLPGNHCPELAEVSIAAFAAAFSHAIDARFAGRPVAIAGVSTGAIIALAIRAPSVNRLVIVEPPLRNEFLWPLLGLRTAPVPGWESVIWPIFGIAAERVEVRDYLPLLDELAIPTVALLGSVSLRPRRGFTAMPSLVDEQVRARLEAHPLVEVREVAGAGHDIPTFAPVLLLEVMLEASRHSIEASLPRPS